MTMLEFTKKIKVAFLAGFIVTAPLLITTGFHKIDVLYFHFFNENGVLQIDGIVFFAERFYQFLAVKANVFLTYFPPVFSTTLVLGIWFHKKKDEVVKRGLLKVDTKEFKKQMQGLSKSLAKQLLVSPVSRLKIQGSVPVSTTLEPQNFLFLGQAGSGKTQAILDFTEQISTFEETIIFYDRKPDFFPKYYREDMDFIFYPKDMRSINFQPLKEVKEECVEEDIDFIVGALIVDENKNDAHWNEQARGALKAILLTIYHTTSGSNVELMDFLYENQGLSKLKEAIIKANIASKYGLDIGGILTDDGQGGSVYSTLNKTLNHLRRRDFYSDQENFSLRSFIQSSIKNNIDQRLFVIQTTQEQESYGTWYRLFFSMLSREIRSLPNQRERRIWIIADEFQTLGKMPEIIEELPAEGRSKGACLLLATQSLAKIKSIYGDDGMQAILANLKTKFIFALGDPFSQKQVEEYFGKVEVEEMKESYSEGHDLSSARVNQSSNVHYRSAIMGSEIASLKPLQAFVQIFEYVSMISFSPLSIPDVNQFVLKKPINTLDDITQTQLENLNDFLNQEYNPIADELAQRNSELEEAWKNASSDQERAEIYRAHHEGKMASFSFEMI